jgi:hypothetical protein
LFDFDGVIHSYISGWKGFGLAVDEPVEGIKECIDQLKEIGIYEIVIYSSRCTHEAGIKCIEQYCKEYNIYYDEISHHKKAAFLTIDDRAICFDGNGFSLTEKIKKFKSWQDKVKLIFYNGPEKEFKRDLLKLINDVKSNYIPTNYLANKELDKILNKYYASFKGGKDG